MNAHTLRSDVTGTLVATASSVSLGIPAGGCTAHQALRGLLVGSGEDWLTSHHAATHSPTEVIKTLPAPLVTNLDVSGAECQHRQTCASPRFVR
jgi:hypothetical protein